MVVEEVAALPEGTLRGVEFALPHPEALMVSVRGFGKALTSSELTLAKRASTALRFGLAQRDPAYVRLAEALALNLFGDAVPRAAHQPHHRTSAPEVALSNLAQALERELFRGSLLVRPLEREPIQEVDELPIIMPGPLPPAPRERKEVFFEVRVVDEIGQAVTGADVELSLGGKPHDLVTNAAGVALLENVTETNASVRLHKPVELGRALDPRWEIRRRGRPPSESNTTELVFDGGEIGPIGVKPVVPNTLVIKPRLGRLFVQLVDKFGRVRHAKREYSIEGPEAFEGTTDALGQLQHGPVFAGDYTLKLKLDFFEGTPDETSDEYQTPLVVLEADAAEPQVRALGAVPFAILARLNRAFNTNRAFLLPTALPALRGLRRFFLDNPDHPLLVVGHADTAGDPGFNDALSLDRARAAIAYFEDDVDAWLAFYDSGMPEPKRWGSAEDRMMLVSTPDFRTKPKGEHPVRWFQRTRGLAVDGKAGPETRKQLVTEYLALDGAPLADLGVALDATAHGCGENFPLDETGTEIDAAAEDGKRDPTDRRVELFFFDPEFGIVPTPASENSDAGSTEYVEWQKNLIRTEEFDAAPAVGPGVTFVELTDAHFRSNSAVVLPEGQTPAGSAAAPESAVGVIATALRFNQENDKTLFVAGHCDTTNTVEFNQTLSEERARCALALLIGGAEGRGEFATICDGRHKVADYKQTLAFFARALSDLGFDCDPGAIDDVEATGVEPVRRFQKAYNQNRTTIASQQADLNPDGDMGPLTWGAFFDCHDFLLARELEEDADGLAELRAELVFADPDRRSLGFSEHFPIEELGVDDFRSQENRRIEILFFDPGEEPDLEQAEADPETSELYLPGFFVRTPVPIRTSGRAAPRLKLKLLDSRREPLRLTDYLFEVLGESSSGTTDGEGDLVEPVPEGATTGRITVGEVRMNLVFQNLDPIDTPRGAQTRLSNLGFVDIDNVDGNDNPPFRDLVASFQESADIRDGNGLDGSTTGKIEETAIA